MGTALGSVFVFAPSTDLSVATILEREDFCEREALKAYAEVLKLCQLAETENPRLKCYEAAKAVYWRKLEECQNWQRRE